MTSINDSISTLKGIGPKKEELYNKLGIYTLGDLINYFPYNYQDRRQITPISNLTEDQASQIRGRVSFVVTDKYRRGKKQNLIIKVSDGTGSLDVVFFNAYYLINSFKKGTEVVLYGRVTKNRGALKMIQPEVVFPGKEEVKLGIIPVYRTVKGISQKELRKNIDHLLEMDFSPKEMLPQAIVEENKLCPPEFAIRNLHKPQSIEHYKIAKFRMIFTELFVLQMGLNMMRRGQVEGTVIGGSPKEFIDGLSFTLTEGQQKVIGEIQEDLNSTKAMNRLLQGDVGSGKTIIAQAALFMTVKAGYQGAFMAPTELLAKQHYENFLRDFAPYGIKVGLLTGSLKESEKKTLLSQLVCGEIDIVVGTHAIIQDRVEFDNLALVVTDEQHRFGVNQRSLLTKKGEEPNILVMTATPIPRTIAVVLYGDLDISVLKELPKGRKPIITKVLTERTKKKGYDFLYESIKAGRQGYVVAPLIEESESIKAISAVELFDELKVKYSDLRIGLIHGQMKQEEKDKVMEAFDRGEIDLVVATVVIEVGIDVSNATVMIIENAERFGLAQLHQLRGRVGRGEHQSYCFLNRYGDSDISKKRLKIIEESTDGFYISEKDMELRGPGEIFGTRQHGLPDLNFADLVRHIDLLEKINKQIADYDGQISDELKARVKLIFGERMTLQI